MKRCLKRDRDIGRKAMLSDVKTAFTFIPTLKVLCDRDIGRNTMSSNVKTAFTFTRTLKVLQFLNESSLSWEIVIVMINW